MLQQEIKLLADKIFTNVIENRRHLHRNPELSFQEYKTAVFVKARLDEMNIAWQPMATTGILGIIKGDQPSGEVIALRADMDALKITELNEVEYLSNNKGIMHACGHDVHTSSLLGTAKILQSLKSKFGGTIKLIFQPGEEELPGGASLMIKEGVLENPKPTAVIGQHVMPLLDVGKIGIRKGKFMASKDDLYITVYGKGGHGAQPHLNVDAVLIAAHIITALQQVVSRMSNPSMPSVLSIGRVFADGSTNVMPAEVSMEGTFRTMAINWRTIAHLQMEKIAKGIAESMGGDCTFKIVSGYPFLINEEKLTEQVCLYAQEYLGKENVVEIDIWMASEDFAYYTQASDACFYLLGVGNKQKGIAASLHTATFNIDEDALALSTGLMSYIALKRLGN